MSASYASVPGPVADGEYVEPVVVTKATSNRQCD